MLAVRPFADGEDNAATVASNVVLWMLLLSGSALKWARLGAAATRGVAIAQVALTSGLGALVLVAVAVRYWRQLLALPGRAAGAVKAAAVWVARAFSRVRRGGAASPAGDDDARRKGGKVAPAPDGDEYADAVEGKAADEEAGRAGGSGADATLIRAAGATGSGAPLLAPPTRRTGEEEGE